MPNSKATLTANIGLSFIRHGATAPNAAGLRCGGDLDAPLTALGREQAHAAALRVQAKGLRLKLVVHSGLQRTRETAHIVATELRDVATLCVAAFAERHLGRWNLTPLADHEAELAAGHTPPGGETNAAFVERIRGGLAQLLPRLPDGVLLVGSQGVARVLGEFSGQSQRVRVANGQVLQYSLATMPDLDTHTCSGSRA